jgi:hypothetical protein
MRFLLNTTKRTKNLIVILLDLNVTNMPLSQQGGHTQITVFSLATEAGQEEQLQSRTTLQEVAALIEKGSHLQKPLRLLPP